MIIRLWAFLTRRRLVWLRDHDGDVTLSIATIDPWGDMVAERHWPYKIRSVRLLPDGKVAPDCYVKEWKYVK